MVINHLLSGVILQVAPIAAMVIINIGYLEDHPRIHRIRGDRMGPPFISHEVRPQPDPVSGDVPTITMVITHLLSGIILQVPLKTAYKVLSSFILPKIRCLNPLVIHCCHGNLAGVCVFFARHLKHIPQIGSFSPGIGVNIKHVWSTPPSNYTT